MKNFVSKKWNLEIQVDFTPKNIKRAKKIIAEFAKPMASSGTTVASKIKQTAKILIGKTEEQERKLEENEVFGGFEAVEQELEQEQEPNTKIISQCEELSGDHVDPNLNEVRLTEEEFGGFESDGEYGFDL